MRSKFRYLYHEHFKKSGGILDLLPIALPMVISQSFDTAMMFIDRLFLSRLGEGYMAACMCGGQISFTTMTFFIGLLSYSGTLVAHAWGAKRYEDCTRIVSHGFLLAIVFFPLLILLNLLCIFNFDILGHSPEQTFLERQYFSTLMFFVLFPLLRSVLAGFFTGIGKTHVIVYANFVALIVNVVANYLLIYGIGPFPRLEIMGAAIGTGLSTVTLTVLLAGYYLYTIRHNQIFAGCHCFYRFSRRLFIKLWEYGSPCGLELLMNMAAFTCVISMLHSYGTLVADSVTIVFNWDLIAFVPMLGMQIGVTTLVGQYMGARKPELAERVTYSGFKVAIFYATMMQLIFLIFTTELINVFKPAELTESFVFIQSLSTVLLRLAALYILFDGMILVFTGALRGAGDTAWVMKTNIFMHWLMVLGVGGSVWVWKLDILKDFTEKFAFWLPVISWMFFVITIMCIGLIFIRRFRRGKWKELRILEH